MAKILCIKSILLTLIFFIQKKKSATINFIYSNTVMMMDFLDELGF